MLEYDTALKNVLQKLSAGRLEQVTGFAVARWHNVELPKVRSRRADLLGDTADGELVHIELQSTRDTDMGLRMAEYALAIRRQFGRMPAQVVLYVGYAPVRIQATLDGPHLAFSCLVIDLRELEAERWLASERVGDNIVAILLAWGTNGKRFGGSCEGLPGAIRRGVRAALRSCWCCLDCGRWGIESNMRPEKCRF